MKTALQFGLITTAGLLSATAFASDNFGESLGVRTRIDIGGAFAHNPGLTEIGGPITGGTELKLSPGWQFSVGIGRRLTPWMLVEFDLGETFATVDAVGNWTYPDSTLSQMSLMANLVFEPETRPVVPFFGVGGDGIRSELSFGNYRGIFSEERDGSGEDWTPAFQAFAGVRYDFSDVWSVGVVYRFLLVGEQDWEVKWWNGNRFRVGTEMSWAHSVCLSLNARF